MSTCFAIQNPVYKPAMRIITAITRSNPAQVTTSFAHGYVSGIIARLDVPPADGMLQVDGLTGTITVTGATTFTIDIDTTHFNPFSIPVTSNPHINTCAQVVPIGEVSSTLVASTVNVLPY